MAELPADSPYRLTASLEPALVARAALASLAGLDVDQPCARAQRATRDRQFGSTRQRRRQAASIRTWLQSHLGEGVGPDSPRRFCTSSHSPRSQTPAAGFRAIQLPVQNHLADGRAGEDSDSMASATWCMG